MHIVNKLYKTQEASTKIVEASNYKVGDDLLSHISAVPSALMGLTSLFGMGRGGSPSQ